MKVVVLLEDDVVDGRYCVAGQVVSVPDGYAEDNIKRVVASSAEMAARALEAQQKVKDKQKKPKGKP